MYESWLVVSCPSVIVVGKTQGEPEEGEMSEKNHGDAFLELCECG